MDPDARVVWCVQVADDTSIQLIHIFTSFMAMGRHVSFVAGMFFFCLDDECLSSPSRRMFREVPFEV